MAAMFQKEVLVLQSHLRGVWSGVVEEFVSFCPSNLSGRRVSSCLCELSWFHGHVQQQRHILQRPLLSSLCKQGLSVWSGDTIAATCLDWCGAPTDMLGVIVNRYHMQRSSVVIIQRGFGHLKVFEGTSVAEFCEVVHRQ